MKVVIHRVAVASVKVKKKTVGQIDQGLVLFLGVGERDEKIKNQNEKIKKFAEKILKMRIFEDQGNKFDKSLRQVGGEVLVIPQFTLFADCSKGNRPYFGTAARPEIAKPLFGRFVKALKKSGLKVESGVFGAKMEVELVNDGPVTIVLEA